MFYMTEPIHNSGKVVTIDNSFCIAAGILALLNVGVHGLALIKKRAVLAKHATSQEIEDHMKDKLLGYMKTYK